MHNYVLISYAFYYNLRSVQKAGGCKAEAGVKEFIEDKIRLASK